MALIAVLWITSLLALMAAGIGSSGRTVSRFAFNTAENAKARLAADAGVQQVIFDLLTESDHGLWQPGGASNEMVALGQAEVLIRVRDEDGKIDINAASPALLRGLFLAVGLEEEQAGSLAARVIDFRDDDSDLSPLGAEDADYEAVGRFAGAADRPLRHLAELTDILGVSDAIYARLRPHLTIYSDAEGVDPMRASEEVLKALPGMTAEALEAIRSSLMSSAEDDPFLALPPDVTLPFEDYLLPSRELIFEISATGESRNGARFVREAIVALDGGQDDLPFTIFDWRTGSP